MQQIENIEPVGLYCTTDLSERQSERPKSMHDLID